MQVKLEPATILCVDPGNSAAFVTLPGSLSSEQQGKGFQGLRVVGGYMEVISGRARNAGWRGIEALVCTEPVLPRSDFAMGGILPKPLTKAQHILQL